MKFSQDKKVHFLASRFLIASLAFLPTYSKLLLDIKYYIFPDVVDFKNKLI